MHVRRMESRLGPQEQLHTQCERAANRNPAGGPNNQETPNVSDAAAKRRDGGPLRQAVRNSRAAHGTKEQQHTRQQNRRSKQDNTPHRLPGLRPVRLCSALALLGPPPMACSPGPPPNNCQEAGGVSENKVFLARGLGGVCPWGLEERKPPEHRAPKHGEPGGAAEHCNASNPEPWGARRSDP